MSNLSYEQIEAEYQRQTRLCTGVGAERQLQIVVQQWGGTIKAIGDGQAKRYEIELPRLSIWEARRDASGGGER